MTYELAKQLKEAGLNQKEDGILIFPDATFVGFSSGVGVFHPTLSELIEACGENGLKIALIQLDNGWQASGRQGIGIEQGSTPEEAVANLYLALRNNYESR